MQRAWHWTRVRTLALGRWAAENIVGVIFSGSLAMASVGFALAWLPLGFIFPGVVILGILVAWRWRMTPPPKPPE